jgi:hypothetical protein
MLIDDSLEIRLRELEDATHHSVARESMDVTVAGILSVFPVAGACIQTLLSGKAQRNVHQRILELFLEMRTRLEEIKASVPDENYFGSEEFQTLLALALEQLQTTHDQNKRKMLARALANSGWSEFCGDHAKEQYIRTLRDLSPADLAVLKMLAAHGTYLPPRLLQNSEPRVQDTTVSSLARLIAFGLVDERLTAHSLPTFSGSTPRAQDIQRLFDTFIKPPNRECAISRYGKRFLQFLSSSA